MNSHILSRSLATVAGACTLAFACAAQAAPSADGFTFVGSATRHDPFHGLTPPVSGQAGAMWRSDPVDLTRTWSVHFGVSMTGQGGLIQADGVAFVVQGNGRFALDDSGGAGLGFGGITSAASVIQTYSNDHVGLTATGSPFDAKYSPIPLGFCTNLLADEVVTWHPLKRKLTMTGTLNCDGAEFPLSDELSVNLVGLLGKRWATVGLTGATGASYSDQRATAFTFEYLDGHP